MLDECIDDKWVAEALEMYSKYNGGHNRAVEFMGLVVKYAGEGTLHTLYEERP